MTTSILSAGSPLSGSFLSPPTDLRSFHAAVMLAPAPSAPALALRTLALDPKRRLRSHLAREMAIFWPSWL